MKPKTKTQNEIKNIRLGDCLIEVGYTDFSKAKQASVRIWTTNLNDKGVLENLRKAEHFQEHCGEQGRKHYCEAPTRLKGKASLDTTGNMKVVKAFNGWRQFQPLLQSSEVRKMGTHFDTLCFYDIDGPKSESGRRLRELTDEEKDFASKKLQEFLQGSGCVIRTAGNNPKGAIWVRDLSKVDYHLLLLYIHVEVFKRDPIYAPALGDADITMCHLTGEALENLYQFSLGARTPLQVEFNQELPKLPEPPKGVFEKGDRPLRGGLEGIVDGLDSKGGKDPEESLRGGLEGIVDGLDSSTFNIEYWSSVTNGFTKDIDWDQTTELGLNETDAEINARLLKHNLLMPLYEGEIPRSCFGRKVSKRATTLFQFIVSMYETLYGYEDDTENLGIAIPQVLIEQHSISRYPENYKVKKVFIDGRWKLDSSNSGELIREAVMRGVLACSSQDRYRSEDGSYIPGQKARSYIVLNAELKALIDQRIAEKRANPRHLPFVKEIRPQSTLPAVDRLWTRLTHFSLETTEIEDGTSNIVLGKLLHLCTSFEVYYSAAISIPAVSSRQDRVASLKYKWKSYQNYLARKTQTTYHVAV